MLSWANRSFGPGFGWMSPHRMSSSRGAGSRRVRRCALRVGDGEGGHIGLLGPWCGWRRERGGETRTGVVFFFCSSRRTSSQWCGARVPSSGCRGALGLRDGTVPRRHPVHGGVGCNLCWLGNWMKNLFSSHASGTSTFSASSSHSRGGALLLSRTFTGFAGFGGDLVGGGRRLALGAAFARVLSLWGVGGLRRVLSLWGLVACAGCSLSGGWWLAPCRLSGFGGVCFLRWGGAAVAN
jgi:hypothetical protein